VVLLKFSSFIAARGRHVHPTSASRESESLHHRPSATPCLPPRDAQTSLPPCIISSSISRVQRGLHRWIAAPPHLVVVVRFASSLVPFPPCHREETLWSASRSITSTSRLAPPPCTHRCGWEAHACVACEPDPLYADALLRRRLKRWCRRRAGRVGVTSPEPCVQATWMRKYACVDGWMGRGTTVGLCSWT